MIEQHGDQQHHAEEYAEPVRRHAGVANANLDHAKDEGAETCADHGAIAARQQGSADHRGDDRLEFLFEAPVRCRRANVANLQHGEQTRTERSQDKERDLHAPHRDADILGCHRVAAGRKNPVAETGLREHERADGCEHDPPDNHFWNARHERLAVVEHFEDSYVAEPREYIAEGNSMEKGIGEPVFRGNVAHARNDRPVGEHDRQRERQAAQDEQEGQRDNERRQARAHDEIAVQCAEQHRAREGKQDRE